MIDTRHLPKCADQLPLLLQVEVQGLSSDVVCVLPIQFHFLFLISILSWFVSLHNSSFVVLMGHDVSQAFVDKHLDLACEALGSLPRFRAVEQDSLYIATEDP